MHIADFARNCAVSQSTITRFVREMSVKGFQEFKILLAEELSRAAPEPEVPAEEKLVYEDITARDDHRAIMKKIHFRLVDTLNETLVHLDPDVIKAAVDAIDKADTLAFFAMGSSTLAVENALMRFLRIGKKCIFFKDLSIQQMSAVSLDKSVAAVGISNSGRTRMVVSALETARAVGATTIGITSFPDSPLAKAATIKIFTPFFSVPFGRPEYHESMVSKIAQIMVIDILYSAYAVRHYKTSIAKLEETNKFTKASRAL